MIEKKLISINPKNNIEFRSWDVLSLNDINIIIGQTAQAQVGWSEIDLISRLDYIKILAHILNQRAKGKSGGIRHPEKSRDRSS